MTGSGDLPVGGPPHVAALLGECLRARACGRQEGARELVEQGRVAAEMAGSVAVAETLLVRALLAGDDGEHMKAERLWRRAAATADGGQPTGRSIQLRAHAGLGGLYRAQGRYRQAERVLRAALADCDTTLATNPLDTARLCNELGMLYKYTGEFDLAEPLYRRALTLAHITPGPASDDLAATIWHNIGGLAHARGDYRAAEAPARRAVSLRTRALGRDHLSVAIDKAALAPILLGLGRTEEAHTLLLQILSVFRDTLGPDHYEVAVTLHNLGGTAHHQGNHEAAEHHFRQALRIKETLLGPHHPDLAPTLTNLALLHRKDDDLAGAAALYERARAILTRTVQPDHPTLHTIHQALTELHQNK